MASGGVIAVTTLAALLRLVYLGRESLWLDELFSVAFANLNGQTLWRVVSTAEANMALYYYLLHFWIRLGQSEAMIRSLSAVTGLMTVPVVYLLGKRMFGTRVALLGALLLAANTFHIRYSQEARGYSLVVLLITLSCLFFVRAMERESRSDWAWYVVTGTLAVYSHFFALLVLVSGYASLVMFPPRNVPWRRLLVSVALIGFLTAPLAFYLLKYSTMSLTA